MCRVSPDSTLLDQQIDIIGAGQIEFPLNFIVPARRASGKPFQTKIPKVNISRKSTNSWGEAHGGDFNAMLGMHGIGVQEKSRKRRENKDRQSRLVLLPANKVVGMDRRLSRQTRLHATYAVDTAGRSLCSSVHRIRNPLGWGKKD